MSLDTRLRSLASDYDADASVAADDLDGALRGAMALGHRKVVRRRTTMAAMALVAVFGVGAAVIAATGGDAKTTDMGVVDNPDSEQGGDDPGPVDDVPKPDQQTPTTQAPPTPAAPGALPKSGQPIANGRYFGFVRGADPTAQTIRFDVAQWLEGEAADKAAQQDGEDDTPDYYVRNNSTEVRTLTGDADTRITLERQPGEKERSSFSGLATRVGETNGGLYAWVTLKDGKVTLVEEQWVP